MATMGRKRAETNKDLEPRVYLKHGAYYYVHNTGKWERLSTDKDEANRKARVFNDPTNLHGTLVYWLDQFLIDCERRVALKSTIKGIKLSQRTYEDYRDAILGRPARMGKDGIEIPAKPGPLRVNFAPPITPLDVTPQMVQDFLDDCAEAGNGKQGNLWRACLSAAFSWMLRKNHVPGMKINPCMRASGVKRNPEKKRELYVSHADYHEVYAAAGRTVRLLMELTYRTLQRPESDIVTWTENDITRSGDRRYLEFKQNKTGMRMKIGFSPAMEDLLPRHEGVVRKLRAPLVATLKGEKYTYDGISSMLRRVIVAINEKRVKRGEPEMQSFGFRDLKGKGATDMYYIDKKPLAEIQQLLGHASQTTTEIYIKQRWRETAEPNMVALG